MYEGDIDHIKGIVYAKDLLQVTDDEAHTKTVRDLMKPEVYFVPETKLGSELLREMQRDNIRMAIVDRRVRRSRRAGHDRRPGGGDRRRDSRRARERPRS